jgi:hypothetical protein
MSMNTKLIAIIAPHTSEPMHEGNPSQIIEVTKKTVNAMSQRIKQLEKELEERK